MIIFLIDYFTERINEFKRRNRNRPTNYRFFLIWLSFFILITAIFYSLGLFNIEDEIINNHNITKSIVPQISVAQTGIEELDLYKINSSLPINKKISLNEIKNIIPPATVLQTNAASIPQIPLYDEVLKTVSKIPPPLNFVDDYKFEL